MLEVKQEWGENGMINDMEGTPIKPESALVPLSEVPVQPEAYERAPTLMAGVTAGSQGQVEVWSPEKREIWKPIRRRGGRRLLFYGVLTLLLGIHHGYFNPTFLIIWSIPTALSGALTLAFLRRPPYLTTDAAGMGIATWRGSHALRWSDIQSVEVKGADSYYPWLKISAPAPVTVRLHGHSPRRQQELLSLIIDRAHLQADPEKKSRFIRDEFSYPALPMHQAEDA